MPLLGLRRILLPQCKIKVLSTTKRKYHIGKEKLDVFLENDRYVVE
jgi:hypothetical protein